MNELTEIKSVPFMGRDLMAAKAEDGTIYAGVSYICNGMGMSEGQVKAERVRIRNDSVLSKGGRNFVLPSGGGSQETLCLELDYLPLWLAKISITPTVKAENPQLAERLVQYQLKAKDALAAAFLQKRPNTMAEQLLEQAKYMVEQERRIAALETGQTQMRDTMSTAFSALASPTVSRDHWQVETRSRIRQMCMEFDLNFQEETGALYKSLEESAGCNLEVRVKHQRERMKVGGAKYADRQAVNKLTVIAHDQRLREIFAGVVQRRYAQLVAAKMPKIKEEQTAM